MKNSMLLGLGIGMVAGACVACNCKKARKLVSDTQDQIMSKLCPQDENCDCGCNGGAQDGSID